MICPHCSTVVKLEWDITAPLQVQETDGKKEGIEIFYGECPNCDKLVIGMQNGILRFKQASGWEIDKIVSENFIYPKTNSFQNSIDIPKQYLEDYEEAIKVLSASPKASAALTRRLLQNILREEFNISEKSLAKEIEIFTNKTDIPSYITDAVDAVRQVGNIAAHPSKDLSTGEIVPVEKGEAEWLIEVIEQLFDFVFIQPKKLEKRKQELNLKLDKIGKPQMK
ncbi:DUF4145 domain-containing protein [Chryseobacterium schmidteae]|uniref:DUF4145 domain-containing protein n=1 Tax=Chryseobacterium schmidteae TaxID=2730404 RepID=UPI001E55F149|nr:DUF4145 domain-containing protein [Chryseobacterium schmidteae]